MEKIMKGKLNYQEKLDEELNKIEEINVFLFIFYLKKKFF